MKQTKYSRVEAACAAASEQLQAMLAGNRLKDLPKTFRERINQLRAEIDGHELEQYREQLTPVSGDYTTVADLLMIIKDATGYTRWNGHSVKYNDCVAPDAHIFRDRYGLDVRQQDLKYFNFTRDSHDHGDMWLVTVCAMPGCVWVSMDTGRTNWTMDPAIVSNHQFADAFHKEMQRQGFA